MEPDLSDVVERSVRDGRAAGSGDRGGRVALGDGAADRRDLQAVRENAEHRLGAMRVADRRDLRRGSGALAGSSRRLGEAQPGVVERLRGAASRSRNSAAVPARELEVPMKRRNDLLVAAEIADGLDPQNLRVPVAEPLLR